MQIGDLVKRKPEWGEWVKHNPWMHTKKDFEIGVIVQEGKKMVFVHWPETSNCWVFMEDLKRVNENENK